MSSVLYEAPGPRTRRRSLWLSVVATVVLALLAAVVAQRLAAQDQFSAERWGPLIDPGNPQFQAVWRFLGTGLRNTLVTAAWAIALSLVLGTLVAVTRVSASRLWRGPIVAVMELLRGVPVVLAVFFAARVLPELGLELPTQWYLVIGLTAYNMVVIAEIVRAGINAVPRGQREAAQAIGLRSGQVMRIVLLPQAFRIMLPALISQLVVVLKDTSLGAFISYQELLRTSNVAIQTLHNPIQTYIVVGAIYVTINYLLSRVAVFTQRRLAGAGTSPDRAGIVVGTEGGVREAGGGASTAP